MTTAYVRCTETNTSPAPSPGAQAIGLKPNMVCGARVPVNPPHNGPMWLRCPYGHIFVGGPNMVEHDV